MFYLLFFILLSFCPVAFAQYVDQDVWDVREQSFLNIKKMISNNRRKRLRLIQVIFVCRSKEEKILKLVMMLF